MKINAMTEVITLIGSPVKQSFSPNIHNYLLEKYNINSLYNCFDVKKENLQDAINGIKALDIKGANVTIPHKVDVMKYLDSINYNAKLIGAVNTIKNENGNLIGYNTDGKGFVKSIKDNNHQIKNKKVLILGAGGACRSIAVELANEGAKSIEIRNRSEENARLISNLISDNFDVESVYSTKLVEQSDLEECDILINTTPIGMESEECPIDKNIEIHKKILVCDIVYKPHKTELIKWANRENLDVIYGIDMLINQAIEAFYIWTDIKASKKDLEAIKQIYSGGIIEKR